jgi:nicotinamide mononucleotide transporter
MFVFGLLGDMLINVYYTVMSIYGWILWSKHSDDHIHVEVKKAAKIGKSEASICRKFAFRRIDLLSQTVY